MNPPDLDAWINLLESDGRIDNKEEHERILSLLKELRERRKVRHPNEIRKQLEREKKEPIIGSLVWRRVLEWVLTPEKEEKE